MSGNLGKLLGVVFRVQDLQNVADFYGKVLGMQLETSDNAMIVCQYPGEGSLIKLVQLDPQAVVSKPQKSSKKSVYWKIGLSLEDVDLARLKIIQSGITVSNPSQFLDIGYLCHLTDPEGRSIELLQHCFAENFIKPEEKVGMTLGQECMIGQVTLRCSNIQESLQFYRHGIFNFFISPVFFFKVSAF